MTLASWICLLATFAPPEGQARQVSFNHQIRPLLSDRCYNCHGPDERTRKGGLRLDVRDAAIETGAIVPGKPGESELITRIHATDRKRMPPAKSNLDLTPKEKDLLSQWIAEGAVYETHWSFLPPKKSNPPSLPGNLSPIDAFIRARLAREGLKPAPGAAPETWLRRVTFDLTGLPPTPEEITSFLKDPSPRAREAVVERLLASPRFGERMAIWWLDLARYADSYGYQADADTDFWPWRDWVVRAFNENLSYDQFLTWQLAGDLLPQPTRDQRLATAFNRLHRMTNEGGSIPEEWRLEYVADRVHTLGTAFLGLTLECCRCHDHKYDPVSMREYYQLSAFFNNIDEWGTYDSARFKPTPTLPLPSPEQTRQLEQTQSHKQQGESKATEARTRALEAFPAWLKSRPNPPGKLENLLGHYTFDEMGMGGAIANQANAGKPGNRSEANRLVAGKSGKAVEFSGDDPANFPLDLVLERHQPFTVSTQLWWPKDLPSALIFHKSAGTDTGFHGPEARVEEGKVILALVRFWPGNAAAVKTKSTIPLETWTRLVFVSDGSGTAGGLEIWIDGKKAELEILRDGLSKNIEPAGGGITVGERMRTPGLRRVLMDDLWIFSRALSSLEIQEMTQPGSLAQSWKENPSSDAVREFFLAQPGSPLGEYRDQLQKVRQAYFQKQTEIPEIPTMVEMPNPRPAHVLARGAYDSPKDQPVTRAVPSVLGSWDPQFPKNRLGLAKWLTRPEHPLTARVAVNQLWQLFFGKGLVTTSENFGLQGNLPTHPELLDWLAVEFLERGWNIKSLCKAIVLSETYAQSSSADAALRQADPDNLLYGRVSPRRLGAEMLRDQALSCGGVLVEKLGGPPVKPYQPPGLWRGQNAFLPEYVADKGEGLHRKSLYTFWRRTSPPPNMLAFDAPTRETCTARRQTTSTPLQPLVLLNDPQWVEAARGLGLRMLRHAPDRKSRIEHGFLWVAGRKPNPSELRLLETLWEEQIRLFQENPRETEKFLRVGELTVPGEWKPEETATAASVAAALLNLDAATTLR